MLPALIKTEFWEKMRPCLSTALLLFAIESLAQEDCPNLAAKVLKTKTESYLDTWLKLQAGYEVNNIQVTNLHHSQVSQKTRDAMEKLEASGGQGIYQQIKYSDGDSLEVIRIVSPPQNGLYGSAFGEIFREINAHNIPAFVNAHFERRTIRGTIIVNNIFTKNAEAVFFVHPTKSSDIANRHELKHVQDLFSDSSQFQQALAELSWPFIHFLNKDEAMVWGDQQKEEAALSLLTRLLTDLAEVRASEASVQNLFNSKTIKEVVTTPTFLREIWMYQVELYNASRANINLLIDLRRLSLSHFNRPYYIIFKATTFFIAANGMTAIIVAPISLGVAYLWFYFTD